jgi:probable O-glycosylation ligase (exosortase A-associated)
MKDTELNKSLDAHTQSRLGPFSANLTPRHLILAGMIMLSLFCGAALVRVSPLHQLVMIAAVPAVLVILLILKDPINGIYLFYLYDYLRPYDFIPALRPLRLSMVIEIMTLISWLLYLKRTGMTIKWWRFNFLYLGFIGVIGISVLLALNNRLAINIFQLFVINFVMFIIVTNRMDSAGKLDKLIWLLLLIFTYFSIRGIINFASGQFDYGSKRTSGVVGSSFISDENDFALALNFMIPFAYFYFTEKTKGIRRYLSLGILIFLVLGVIASGSRGGWIGLMVAVFYCLLMSERKAVSIVIVSLLAFLIVLFAPAKYWQGVESITRTNEGTAKSRISYWKAGVRMLLTYPLFGVGAGNGPIRMPEFVTGFRDSNTQWGRTFHGTFPQVMAELGGSGLILYLMMIFLALKKLRQMLKARMAKDEFRIKLIAKAIIGSIIAYFVTATFLSTAYYPQLWTLYAFTTILVFNARTTQNRIPSGNLIADSPPISLSSDLRTN